MPILRTAFGVLGVCSLPSHEERLTLMIPLPKSTSSILRPHNSPDRIPVPDAAEKNAFICSFFVSATIWAI